VLFGVGSAIGMAGAAVLSRRGYGADATFPWLDASLWRNLGGLAVTSAIWVGMRAMRHATGGAARPKNWRAAWPWLVGTSVLGPALGVACYQLALQHLQAGQVQAIVALVPVMVVPLAWWIDGDRPRPRSLIGGAVGVAGVIGMALTRS
jgi:drug/metabolite transporter (DMT)-like permease